MYGAKQQIIRSIRQWNPEIFSFTCTRDPLFRFQSGQYTTVALPGSEDGEGIACSLASAPEDEALEFVGVRISDQSVAIPLNPVKQGDRIFIGGVSSGNMVLNNLLPGRVLWLVATGTGITPFLSIIRDPSTYDRYERVVLAHTSRDVSGLIFRDYIMADLPRHERLGAKVRHKLIYYPTVTDAVFPNKGLISDLIISGSLFTTLRLAPLHPDRDRVMLCGDDQMLFALRAMLDAQGFIEGGDGRPGHYLTEHAVLKSAFTQSHLRLMDFTKASHYDQKEHIKCP